MKQIHKDAEEVEKRIKVAFQALYADGYFTAVRFWCCQSCGRAAIPDKYKNRFVFYHEHDHDMLLEVGECYLVWEGEGIVICRRLTEAKLTVEWNSSPTSRILVSLPSIN